LRFERSTPDSDKERYSSEGRSRHVRLGSLFSVLSILACWASIGALALAQEKYALIVGINDYPRPIPPLHGCVNDTNNVRNELIGRFGFRTGNIESLFDGSATRGRILAGIDAYAARVRRGDVFVFGYSGHGTVFPDERSEELDETRVITPRKRPPGKYDAALVPVDSRDNNSGKPWGNLILDDELYAHFKRFTDKGCLVVVISDSCHSGTLGRNADRVKAISTEEALGIPYDRIGRPANSRTIESRDLGGLYLTITSSTDEQVSIEWQDDEGRDCGLFIYSFLKALRVPGANRPSYQQVYDYARREVLRLSEQGQEPQVDTRFFSGGLNVPLFSAPGAVTPIQASNLRVVVRVQDANGKALEGSAFTIFRPGVRPAQGQIRMEDMLLLGKTDAKGLFDSSGQLVFLAPGLYLIKVVRADYRTFQGERWLRENGGAGIAVLSFQLVKE
jgi:hypothetical protein